MKLTKDQKGITLLALIITIIVLVILTAIVLSTLTGSSGIIDNANRVVEKHNLLVNEEENMINVVEKSIARRIGNSQNSSEDDGRTYTITYNANGGTGTMAATTASAVAANGFTAPGNARVFKEWNTEANGTGTSYAAGATVNSDLTLYAIWSYTTASILSIGNEVSIKGEEFYVLENSSNTQETVTLLAKYNLDKDADATTGKYYQKPNAMYSETGCEFSNTNYWSGDWEEGTRMNLNTYTTATVANNNSQTKANNAIMRARDYATSTIGSGAEGRLLTYEEADTLISSYGTMIYGRANRQEENSVNYLNYWLSTTSNSINFCVAMVNYEGVWQGYNISQRGCGVRPVITVSKSLTQ